MRKECKKTTTELVEKMVEVLEVNYEWLIRDNQFGRDNPFANHWYFTEDSYKGVNLESSIEQSHAK